MKSLFLISVAWSVFRFVVKASAVTVPSTSRLPSITTGITAHDPSPCRWRVCAKAVVLYCVTRSPAIGPPSAEAALLATESDHDDCPLT